MPYRTTNPAGAKELIEGEEGWTYVDVRSPEEFTAGHVPGAYNVPIFFHGPAGLEPNPAFLEAMTRRFPTDARLILGCAAGGRSMRACELLAHAGFEHLANMHGGFAGAHDPAGNLLEPGWAACGYPTATEPHPERTWSALGGG